MAQLPVGAESKLLTVVYGAASTKCSDRMGAVDVHGLAELSDHQLQLLVAKLQQCQTERKSRAVQAAAVTVSQAVCMPPTGEGEAEDGSSSADHEATGPAVAATTQATSANELLLIPVTEPDYVTQLAPDPGTSTRIRKISSATAAEREVHHECKFTIKLSHAQIRICRKNACRLLRRAVWTVFELSTRNCDFAVLIVGLDQPLDKSLRRAAVVEWYSTAARIIRSATGRLRTKLPAHYCLWSGLMMRLRQQMTASLRGGCVLSVLPVSSTLCVYQTSTTLPLRAGLIILAR